VTVNDDGTIQCHGNWKYEKIKEFTLEPITNCPYSIDGERYECKPVKGIVLPKALNIFCLWIIINLLNNTNSMDIFIIFISIAPILILNNCLINLYCNQILFFL